MNAHQMRYILWSGPHSLHFRQTLTNHKELLKDTVRRHVLEELDLQLIQFLLEKMLKLDI